MDNAKLQAIIEAVLLSADRPLTADQISKLFDQEDQPDTKTIREQISAMQESLSERSFAILDLASGYRLQVKQDYAHWVGKLFEEKPPRYSRATLETLAIIAYRQPVTRADIEDIRGVAVSSQLVRTLLEREWIKVVGHKEVPGRPALYATTKEFLDYFNLKKLDDLPDLQEITDLEQLTDQLTEQLPLEVEATDEDETQANTEANDSEAEAEIVAEENDIEANDSEIVAETSDSETEVIAEENDIDTEVEVSTEANDSEVDISAEAVRLEKSTNETEQVIADETEVELDVVDA